MKHDPVNNLKHYTSGGIETIDYIKAKLTDEQFEGFLIGNIIKCVSRQRFKNGLEDLNKAEWYLTRLIQEKSLEKPKNDTEDPTKDTPTILVEPDEPKNKRVSRAEQSKKIGQYLQQGLSKVEIAEVMGLSKHTVDTYIHNYKIGKTEKK